MSDADARLERLERLTRLRDSGALSADEFAVEKRRVLMGEEARASSSPPPSAPPRAVFTEAYEPAEPAEPIKRRRRLPIATLVAVVAIASAAGAAIFINTTPGDVPGRSAPKAKAKVARVPDPTAGASGMSQSSPQSLPTGGADLARTLSFKNPGQCAFASATDTLFDTLLPRADDGDPAPSPARVTFGGYDLKVASSVQSADDVSPGGRTLKASVRFPEGARWNALKMSRIAREHGDFPETDDTDTRILTFLNPAEDLQSALRNAGVSVPMAPKVRAIDDSGGSCGGTMQVLPVTGGSALICRWGCRRGV